MRKFYIYFPIATTVSSQLSWSHYLEVLELAEKGKDKDSFEFNSKDYVNHEYDYSKAKNLIQYYNDTNSISKSILSSSLYNLAAFSNYFNVIKIYEINIEFTINDYQQ